MFTVSSKETEYLLVKPETCDLAVGKTAEQVDVLQAIYILLLVPVLRHNDACKPLPENHFFAPTLFSLSTSTDHTSLFHQISRNFCPVLLISCFPNT